LAPETAVPKPLPTQSPAQELLSLLENDKDFLDILFGEPSSRKSRESKSKGSNGSIKGESSVNHEDNNGKESPSKKEDKPASKKKQKFSSKSKTDIKKITVWQRALPKRRRNPKTKQSPNPRAASLICLTRAAERLSLPMPSPAVLR
jgi:hypothetical protein